jgi:hypothetical protein
LYTGGLVSDWRSLLAPALEAGPNETLNLSSIAIKAIGGGLPRVEYLRLEDVLLGNLPTWAEPPIFAHSFSAGLGWSIQAERILTQLLQALPLALEQTEFVYRSAWEDRMSHSHARVGAMRNTSFIDLELPSYSPAPSEWGLLRSLPKLRDIDWLGEHEAQFERAQAAEPKNSDPCHTYLHGVESGTEVSLDSLLVKYTECHAAMLRGESEPRLLVFRWNAESDIGFGNMVTFMATAFLKALVFRRAFLIDHESFRHDLRGIFAQPAFEWDLRSATTKLKHWKSLKTAFVSRSCRELVEDVAPVLVIDLSPCVTVTSFITDDIFRPFRPLFPTRQPALIIGALSHALFQPGPQIREIADPIRLQLRNRAVFGIAVRHSVLPEDHMTFMDSMDMIELFEDCAHELASNSQGAIFLIISDRMETKAHFMSAAWTVEADTG